jgi:hypothetical protein
MQTLLWIVFGLIALGGLFGLGDTDGFGELFLTLIIWVFMLIVIGMAAGGGVAT